VQADYIGVPVEGPYKSDHYRYLHHRRPGPFARQEGAEATRPGISPGRVGHLFP
jgi:hypothetical protein